MLTRKRSGPRKVEDSREDSRWKIADGRWKRRRGAPHLDANREGRRG
jgi:hypothetical protein